MPYYKLTSGEVAYFGDSTDAPSDATEITAEQFATIAATPVRTLEQVQKDQTATLYSACQSAITGGFSSSALGSAYGYPSTLTDQANQQAVAASANGGSLYCATSAGTWALVQHTQAQAQQVVSDFVKWLNACQQQLATLAKQVNAADATVATAQAAQWSNPSS